MNEIILNKKKNGMAVLLLSIVLYLAALACAIYGGIIYENGKSPVLLISVLFGCVWVGYHGPVLR